MFIILVSFFSFILLFTLVGIFSNLKRKSSDVKDYVLASNTTSPWLLGISTFATNNSGFMFTAIIGYTYSVGLSAIWITFPWILGDLIASYIFMNKLFKMTTANNSLTYLDIITKSNNNNYKYLRFFGVIVIVIFLGIHSAAQLKATSYAFSSLLNWEMGWGAVLTAIIVTLYSFAGGIRSTIWTDMVQSIIMFFAMLILLIVSVSHIGGMSTFVFKLNNISSDYMNLFPSDLTFGAIWGPFFIILGYIFGGAGVMGQPHLVIRYMAMRNINDIKIMRLSYYGGYTIFAILVFSVGFATKILIPNSDLISQEFLLFDLANNLLPAVLVGIVLAGLFSASVSTIDSQVLSCASSIVNDLDLLKNKSKSKAYLYNKLGTVLVVLLALVISLYNSNTIFSIVFSAWSVLSSVFAPLIILTIMGKKISQPMGFVMMICGFMAMYIWYKFGYPDALYEVVPGVLFGLLSYFIFHRVKLLKY